MTIEYILGILKNFSDKDHDDDDFIDFSIEEKKNVSCCKKICST